LYSQGTFENSFVWKKKNCLLSQLFFYYYYFKEESAFWVLLFGTMLVNMFKGLLFRRIYFCSSNRLPFFQYHINTLGFSPHVKSIIEFYLIQLLDLLINQLNLLFLFFIIIIIIMAFQWVYSNGSEWVELDQVTQSSIETLWSNSGADWIPSGLFSGAVYVNISEMIMIYNHFSYTIARKRV
jgi:hypothetical protein